MYSLIIGPAVGFVVNRWSCRVGTILGGLLVFTGFTCSFFVTKDLPVLLLTYSLIAGNRTSGHLDMAGNSAVPC